MKKIFILIILFLLLSNYIQAQVDESRPFLISKGNKILYGERVHINRYNRALETDIDKRLFNHKDLLFVNADNGFFVYTRGVRYFRAPYMAKRTIKGNLNLFESQIVYVESMHATSAEQSSLFNRKKYFNYFNSGYDNIQRANYKNLYPHMMKNSESLRYLEDYRKAHIAHHSLQVTTYAVYIGSFVLLTKGMDIALRDKDNLNTGKHIILPISILLAGVGVQITSNWFGEQKNLHMRNAFRTYNSNNN